MTPGRPWSKIGEKRLPTVNNTRKYHGYLGLAVLLPSCALMLAGVRPFSTWFYSFAWWPYIFIVDHLVYHVRGNSLWVDRRKEFLFLIPLSVFFWMIFEGANVYLQNWHYINVTPDSALRRLKYFIAYGTVLPAIFETYELLDALGLYKTKKVKPIPRTTKWHLPFVLTGFFFLFVPLFLPKYFFPLTWGSFIFLLEPALHIRGGRSLMSQWEKGNPRDFYLLLTAGLICGGLWEFWNFWAETKWVYTVPFVNYLKIFEMPILGFGGFPPFAVELYIMTNFVSLFRGGNGWMLEDAERRAEVKVKPWPRLIGIILFLTIFILCARLIDLYTVRSYY